MTKDMSEEEIYEAAKKRVKDKRDFYGHLIAYLIVNSILILVWALSGGGYPWFVWCMGPWGIGVVFHFLAVFVFPTSATKERQAIEKEVEKIKKEQS
jgi:hypothetical protein